MNDATVTDGFLVTALEPVSITQWSCARSAQLREHSLLVRKIAGRVSARAPANVGIDELVQAGMIGLDEAITRFESDRGATFDTYASRRIEGAMLDTLRMADSLSREARRRQRVIRNTVQELEHRLLRAPRAQEVANELGWALAQLHDAMVEAGAGSRRSHDDSLDDVQFEANTAAELGNDESHHLKDEHADPAHALQRRQRHLALNRAFDALDERERKVMEMIYEHGLDQADVAQNLGLSAARMSQIHASIVAKLKLRLRDW